MPKARSLRIERNLEAALKPFIIASALPKILFLLQQDAVRIAFSSRKSRILGYYCPPKSQSQCESDWQQGFNSLHTISLQIDLNPYALLFVFIHEWAHLTTRKQYGNKAYPHGKEWKANFKKLFRAFHSPEIFPTDILNVIDDYFQKTSPYFEARLEEACQKYGKDRKSFARTYTNLLRQGIIIPAPYMGIQAEYILNQLQQEQQRKKEKEESQRIARMVHELNENRSERCDTPLSVKGRALAGSLPVNTIIRSNGRDFIIQEQGKPLLRLRDLASGQEARMHYLLQVEIIDNPLP